MARPAVARVASIMLDCNDLDAMVSFWGAVLDVKEKNRFPGYVWMTRISRGGPALAFQQVSEKKATKNRLHLDLSTADPESLISHVEQLGGKRLVPPESFFVVDREGPLYDGEIERVREWTAALLARAIEITKQE